MVDRADASNVGEGIAAVKTLPEGDASLVGDLREQVKHQNKPCESHAHFFFFGLKPWPFRRTILASLFLTQKNKIER